MDVTALIALADPAIKAAKSICDLTSDSRVREQAIELQSRILELQQACSTLIDSKLALQEDKSAALMDNAALIKENAGFLNELRSLEKENAKLESELQRRQSWEAKTAGYAIKEIGEGDWVYERAPDDGQGKPRHPWLCATCFDQESFGILQQRSKYWTGAYYNCATCGLQVLDSTNKEPLKPMFSD